MVTYLKYCSFKCVQIMIPEVNTSPVRVKKGNVDVCPVTKEAWDARAKTKSGDCGGQSVYHCLADSEGGKWERCVEKTLVIEGNCPIFNEDGFIDWKPCDKTKPPCPNNPECFGNNTPSAKTKPDPNNDSGNDVGLVFAVSFGIMLILSAMALLIFFLRRRSSLLSPNEDQITQRLNSDSKEEIVKDHSVHNGIALLMNDDSDVKSIIVVGKFGNSVSSTSRRISKGFQTKKGWVSLECRYTDIPNTVEENTIMFAYGWFGMWNDDLCSKDKAKTACQSLILVTKVREPSLELTKNIDVAGRHGAARIVAGVTEEIVKTMDVNSGLEWLSSKDVRSIVVVGKFGSSVFSTSRLISERFKLEKKWRSMEYRYTNIPDTVKENTILYVYGWFGMWNDDLCSVVNVKTACQSLIRILNETNNVKLIIGMRSDLYKKYHQELEEADDDMNTSLFHHEIFLDTVDVRKDAKYKNYFEENIQKQCKENDCECKSLTYEMLRKGKDKVVGMPLKINAIQRYHELIPNYLRNWNILKVMRDHFSDIEKDRERRNVYEWIMYICLKGYFCRSDPFDTELVEEMNFGINQTSFDESDSELSRYVRMRNSDKLRNESSENARYVFWHPFIYICAFHYLFDNDPEFMMKNCNVDAILQLVRPRGFKTSYFEVTANKRCTTLFKERIQESGKEEEYAQHPLFKMNVEEEEEDDDDDDDKEEEEDDDFLEYHIQRIVNREYKDDSDSS
uniref:Uncharacterized protein n=1 Tax=Magallana gigas TaxID=29159 RepID=K1PX79_MAGGI